MLKAPGRFHAAHVQTHLTDRTLSACRIIDPAVAEIVIDA